MAILFKNHGLFDQIMTETINPPGVSLPPRWSTAHAVVVQANTHAFTANERIRHPWVESRMVLWCLHGRGEVRAEGQRHDMTAADYLLLPWPHAIAYHPDASDPFHLAGVHLVPHHDRRCEVVFAVPHNRFDPSASLPGRRDIETPGLEGVARGSLHHHEPLEALLQYILLRFQEQTRPGAQDARRLGVLLMEELRRTRGESPIGSSAPMVEEVMAVVRLRLDRSWSIQELADHAGCSPSTLRRLFQRHRGMSPHRWIAQAKARHARRLLTTTSLSVAEIGRRLGIDDPFQFSRWYKRQTGLPPSYERDRDGLML